VCPTCHTPVCPRLRAMFEPRTGGEGRPRRFAARLSGGASKVMAGNPYVIPKRLLTAPPREWPLTHTFESGYKAVTFV
jgi:hypothetical protein